jgi:hypothetical protein
VVLFDPSLPVDVVSYAMVEQRTATIAIGVVLVVSVFVLLRVRKVSPKATRLMSNCILLLAAVLPLGESLVATRTFTSCLLLAMPAFAVAVLTALRPFGRIGRPLILTSTTVVLLGVSAYRDIASPFSYDVSRLVG